MLFTSTYLLEGLDCADCAAKLEKKIAAVPGVVKAKVHFGTGKLVVEHSGAPSAILQTIEQSGYQISKDGNEDQRARFWNDRKTRLTLLSGFVLFAAVPADALHVPVAAVDTLYGAAILLGAYETTKNGLYALRKFTFDTHLLMTVAALGAVAIGQWSEAATVVFLFSLGNALQRYTMDRTRQSIRSLMTLSPKNACVKQDGTEKLLPVEEVAPGARILIRPGERIPLDGIVTGGSSSVNQSTVTGEAVPVEKQAGDRLFAGTLNENGILEATVTKHYRDSTLARIIHLVEEAQAGKAPLQQFVDRFAKYYTPCVLAGAILLAFIPWLLFNQPLDTWFYRALVLLVISCPCALVISTPVSIVSAIGHASRQGILIKGGTYLEQLANVKAIAFDKTGTLTYGRPAVTDIISLCDKAPDELLSYAVSMEQWSEHPLAKAIIAKGGGLPLHPVTNVRIHPGKGIVGELDGTTLYAGNFRLFQDTNIASGVVRSATDKLEQQGKTAILLGTASELWGVIALSDTLRDTSTATIRQLRLAGIQNIVLLTGDNQYSGTAAANRLKLDHVYSRLLPADKVAVIKNLKESFPGTVMVGDGVNDAPALATAAVGIAMGAIGSDTALETADIALMHDDLSKLPYLIRLSRKTIAIIKENVYFSLLVKLFFILATLWGFTNLWMAVFADTGAALLVIANGMRLMRTLPTKAA
jgi:Cd2+/Zn2+-exporting ATPase